jgi:cation diffusion facilitator CzcD-associated flavoprotein CzcO
MHSAEYHSANSWTGKAGVVIGTANTGLSGHLRSIVLETSYTDSKCAGHDVANDMLKAGLSSVTLVQRSRTCMHPEARLLCSPLIILFRCSPRYILC